MDLKNIDFINYHAASYVNEFMSGDSTTRARMQEILTDFGKQLIDCLPRDGKYSSHENSGLNKPDVTVSLPLSNEQILKGIQTSPRYQLPKEWLKNEHTNSNYMGGFLNAVKWMEGNAR